MREGWNVRPLCDVAQFINGLWKGEAPPFIHIGVIRNTNFTKDGELDDTDIAYIDVETKKFQKRRLLPGDLILEKSGGGPKQPVGRVVLFNKTEGSFSFSNFTAVIRVKDPMVLDSRFLHRYLHWIYVSGRTEAMQSHSTGIRNLNGDAYKAIEVAYPSLTEQRRIVAILDEAFEGIATAKAHAEKNLRNARETSEAFLESLLCTDTEEWVEGPLASLVGPVSTGPFGSMLHKADYVDEGVPLVNPINIVDGAIVFSVDKQIDQATKARLRSYLLRTGDIVVARRGEIGRCAVVSAVEDGWLCGTGCFFIRPAGDVEPDFVAHLIRSRPYRRRLVGLSTGATMLNLSNTVLSLLPLKLPKSRLEQFRLLGLIEAAVLQIGRLTEVYQRKLTALDELKQSLLHQAFSGQL